MGVWIIIVLGMLVIFGSVQWLRPSVKEKKQGQWRHQALMAGMKVSLQGLPAEPKESGIRDDVNGASYILYNPKPSKKDTCKFAVVKQQGWMQEGLPEGWSWYKEKPSVDLDAVSRVIGRLPESSVAIERTPDYSRVIWWENGQTYDPDHLKQTLEKLQAIS
ncbi:hypothetical protein HF888_07645 [Bermanella marisrubri]|uniref:Uncharacterized protein n=1 Tax=Bermanella marisrubri TaxID=207949 RepID=Q1N4S5_9GAMM|nr:hypothetical protein [Bermanella marisrubri]EAT13353.1 hypothetical protein RED65_01295 [Oceanobacter sp. RED65] [Bermanella marisrubri]QIZ84109.1 hypothetical protein HF888_07645 [Bermanella marisrubri]